MLRNIFKKKRKTYIEYNNINSQWNDGFVYVYVKGEIKEHISVDDYREKYEDIENDVFVDPYYIIDEMKQKYGIDEVIEEVHNWR